MSITEIILGEQQIVIAAAMAGMPLAAALVLGIVLRVRALRRAAAARRLAAQVAAMDALTPAVEPDHEPVDPAEAPAQGAAGSPSGLAALQSDEDADAEDDAADDDALPVDQAMQDLLHNIFGEEELANQYEHLMDELDDVSADELAALSRQIIDKLSERTAPEREGRLAC